MSIGKFVSVSVLSALLGCVLASELVADTRVGFQSSGWPGDFRGPIWLQLRPLMPDGSDFSAVTEVEGREWIASAGYRNSWLDLYGGRRMIPARSSFYADSEHPPGFLDPRRRNDLYFIRFFANYFVPGFFAIKNSNGAGVYASYEDRLFVALHPVLKVWGFTFRTDQKPTQGFTSSIDIEGEKKEYQGYGSAHWISTDSMWGYKTKMSVEAERRPYWDRFRYREESYDSPVSQELMRDKIDRTVGADERSAENPRRYRSVAVATKLGVGPFGLLSAGMDRGDVAFRIAVLSRRIPDEVGWYFAGEASFLEMQMYREDKVQTERRLGVGLARRISGGLYEGIVRVGDAPSVGFELRGRFTTDIAKLSVQPAILVSASQRTDSFEYLSAVDQGEAQSRFIERARYALALRILSQDVRAVIYYTGRNSENGSTKEWGYLRLEYQRTFD